MLPESADIVIIGGGILGTSAAFHLAESGQKDILLVDRGPIASGTTPFAAGQTGYLNTDRHALEFGRYCIDFFENFQQRTGYPIDFRQCGSLRVALTEEYQADLERRSQRAQEVGDEVQFISPRRATELVPTFHPPDKCRILLIPRDGYVEPKSVAVAYAAAARDRNVTIRTRVEATGLQITDGRVTGVRTPEGVVQAQWVVLAAGAWTRQFGQRLGLNLRTVPVRHQAFVTAPLRDVLPRQPIVRITEPQIYVRQEAGGLLVGGYGYRPLSFDMDELADNFEIPALEADPIYYQQLGEAAEKFFPTLGNAVIIQERRGLPTISPDGRLIISEPAGAQGLVVMSACGVGGIDRSPGAGRVVADVVNEKRGWIDLNVLSAERFGDNYCEDANLRARCEEVYAHHYHQIY